MRRRDPAGKTCLLQRFQDVAVIEIARDLKRLCPLDGCLIFDARNRFDRLVHGFDTFGATQMHSLDFQGLDLLAFGAGVGVELNARFAALAIIPCLHQSISRTAQGGHIGPAQGHCLGLLIGCRLYARDCADGLLHALHASFAAEMDIGNSGSYLRGAKRTKDGRGDNRRNEGFLHSACVKVVRVVLRKAAVPGLLNCSSGGSRGYLAAG